MDTSPLSSDDLALVEAAQSIIQLRYRTEWHAVGAALRLASGQAVTGVHLEAYVGRIAVCAEAVALGRAVTEFGSSQVETVVAAQVGENGQAHVVSPCGMCRELISDYSPHAWVILSGTQGLYKVRVGDLLPEKYGHRS